eukprot:Gb_18215 [translate_table: standard]
MLSASKSGHNEMSASVLEAERSGPLIWIPFAKEIVPDVDVQKGQLQIKPPKGLLELNLRPEGLSNKEKRQQLIRWVRTPIGLGVRHGAPDPSLAHSVLGAPRVREPRT